MQRQLLVYSFPIASHHHLPSSGPIRCLDYYGGHHIIWQGQLFVAATASKNARLSRQRCPAGARHPMATRRIVTLSVSGFPQ